MPVFDDTISIWFCLLPIKIEISLIIPLIDIRYSFIFMNLYMFVTLFIIVTRLFKTWSIHSSCPNKHISVIIEESFLLVRPILSFFQMPSLLTLREYLDLESFKSHISVYILVYIFELVVFLSSMRVSR